MCSKREPRLDIEQHTTIPPGDQFPLENNAPIQPGLIKLLTRK